jgi:hypothetical protein
MGATIDQTTQQWLTKAQFHNGQFTLSQWLTVDQRKKLQKQPDKSD